MRRFLIHLGFLASFCSSVCAGPKEDALEVLQNWAKAFTASDVEAIVKLHASDATFLGTNSKTVAVTRDEIRKYFEQALLSNRPRGARLDSYSATELSNSAVVISGLDTVTGVRDGQPFSANGRVTFVIAKRGPAWQIVHFHPSATPN